ncbi:MAG TPA: DNA (cytosine-5-)-methyltransferase [Candidatus Bacteroides merdigallinarum]|uniref:Cytosine-specific methyltransferase n=1 Tax=Candidatus Bacteroides merdigallinarum TaxID=2838473 RepID=A0A9D2EA22_9BACE|nr:DNA (cytosine-5-)-methyltransferase [Candidatus Bacteroides merdigallinarum]
MSIALSDIRLSNFPEKISVKDISGEKVQVYFYGPKSYDNQLAVITHCLHGQDMIRDFTRLEAKQYLKEYLEYKFPQAYISDQVLSEPLQAGLFGDFFKVPFPDPIDYKFTFIDLFAGMGGFRLAMRAQGGKCVFSSEWNPFAQKTYLANFGEMPFGDITKEETKRYIPEQFDVLCAGFPCQPFSIAGVSKKKSLGRETGFRDKTQGTLFFDVADIISRHRPKAFFLENVKNLVAHDKGNTFRVIRSTLEELEYSIHYQVMDGKDYVPQHRERIMIVGFDKRRYQGEEHFEFPAPTGIQPRLRNILEDAPVEKYTLSDKLWNYLQGYAEKHKAKGNGFGFGMADLDGITRTLSARYYKDGSEILIPQEGRNPRKLTPRECARLMGYPDNYILDKVSDVQAYRQCGNSVVVPLITAVAKQIIQTLDGYE